MTASPKGRTGDDRATDSSPEGTRVSTCRGRALKNLDISLGLAVIPVQLFTAASSKGVAFHLLHARCGSRLQYPRW